MKPALMNEAMSSEKHEQTEQPNSTDQTEGGGADVTADGSGTAGSSVAEPQSQPAASRAAGGRGLAFLALIVALAALGMTGWANYNELVPGAEDAGPSGEPSVEQERLQALDARVGDLEAEVTDQPLATQERVDEGLGELAESLDQLGDRLDELHDRFDARFADEVAPLQAQVDDLGAAVDGLAERLAGAVEEFAERGDVERQVDRDLRRQMAMLEAAGLLRIGQERAELSADFAGAERAFRRAARVLDDVDDARLDRARRALAAELEALENVRAVDVNRELARLDRLHRESRAWPTRLGDRAQAPAAQSPDTEAPAGWRERLGAAVRGLVRIEARDDLGRTDEQFQAAREQLQLRLVAAQLALSRRAPDALEIHLDAALNLLDDWFDPASEDVAQARSDLEALRSLRFEPPAIELGEALDLVQARLDAF